MGDLHYFPLMAADWLAGEAVTMMTPEQEGAFIRLLCYAWQSSGVPCSLPNDDDTLAHLSRLGKRWAKVGAFVKAQFDVMEDDPTRLRNAKLWNVFQDSMAKHDKRVRSGQAGGIAKAMRKQRSSNATAMVEQCSSNQNQNQKEEPSPPKAAAIRTTWMTPYCLAWKQQYGGDLPVERSAPPLAKLRKEHGDPEVLRRWTFYLAGTEGQYASSHRFASTFGQWTGAPAPVLRPARVLSAVEML